MPDGARASREQMLEATNAFKAYDAATVAYTHCVDAAVDQLSGQYAGVASAADIQNLKVFGTSAHNTAVDQEQAARRQAQRAGAHLQGQASRLAPRRPARRPACRPRTAAVAAVFVLG